MKIMVVRSTDMVIIKIGIEPEHSVDVSHIETEHEVQTSSTTPNPDVKFSQECLSLGQLFVYNAKKLKINASIPKRHSSTREPPLPVYLGLNIHSQTRSKKLIDQLSQLGFSVKYDRVLELEKDMDLAMCKQFEAENVVSHRENNFALYVDCLDSLNYLFFALDHFNYSRWVSVHLRDMNALRTLESDFQNHWVVQKTQKRYSRISPIDQVHEQENCKIKGKGGVIGITENQAALQM
ncbi:hypothetical protein GQR58_013587 [Nymphon striatum]|nr:hypothetical protein GQR58_013587 [Nymphon striatum]